MIRMKKKMQKYLLLLIWTVSKILEEITKHSLKLLNHNLEI